MKIDQTRLFEIVGILAVVVSLIFVTIELRNNTNAINSQTNQGLAELDSNLSVAIMVNPELVDLWLRGTNDPESLTEVEQFRYGAVKHNFFNRWEQAFISYTNGTLTDELWGGWNAQELCNKGDQYFWERNSERFSSKFRAHIDDIFENC